MPAALVFSALLLTCGVEVVGLASGLRAGAGAVARLRSEGRLLADALGGLFDAAGVPFALRAPAARAFLAREAARVEQERGRSFATRAFPDYALHLLPAAPLFAYSRLPARRIAEATAVVRHGNGTVSFDTARCVDGRCERSFTNASDGVAGLIAPPTSAERLYTTRRSLGDISDFAGRLMGTMDQPAFPDVLGRMFGAPGGGAMRPHPTVVAIPIAAMPMPAAGGNPMAQILGRILGGALGGGMGPGGPMARGGSGGPMAPGGPGGQMPGSWSVTRVENGHAVQETTTCQNGKCSKEKREFDVPAGGGGGMPMGGMPMGDMGGGGGGGMPMGGMPMGGMPMGGMPMGGMPMGDMGGLPVDIPMGAMPVEIEVDGMPGAGGGMPMGGMGGFPIAIPMGGGMPTGDMGGLPADMPMGAMPVEIPVDAIPMGAMPMGGLPMGGFPMSGQSGAIATTTPMKIVF